MLPDLLRWVGITVLAATCLGVGAGLGGFAVLRHLHRIRPAQVIRLVEYAESVRTCDSEAAAHELEDDAYIEIEDLLRNREKKDVESLTKYELEALQKFKSYLDRYPPSGSTHKGCVELRTRVNKYLERVPWASKDQARRNFLAKYKNGEPEQAPALNEVIWLNGETDRPLLGGKVVLVDFWGLQCQSCLHSFPAVQRVYDRYRNQGMEVVAVHAQPATETALKTFVLENRYTFQIGQGNPRLCRDFWVRALPSYYLVDRQGRLVWGPEHVLPAEALLGRLVAENPGRITGTTTCQAAE